MGIIANVCGRIGCTLGTVIYRLNVRKLLPGFGNCEQKSNIHLLELVLHMHESCFALVSRQSLGPKHAEVIQDSGWNRSQIMPKRTRVMSKLYQV